MARFEEERSKLATIRKHLFKIRGKCCERCGEGGGIEAHHKIALADGGTNDTDNLVLLCHSCHHSEWHNKCEGNMTFEEFMKRPTLKEFHAIHKGMIENPDISYPMALAIIESIRGFKASCIDTSDRPKTKVAMVDIEGDAPETDTPSRRFLSSVLESTPFVEGQIAERTSSSLQYKKSKREAYCSVVYGWDKVDKQLRRNIDEQHIIGLMMKWYGEGTSFNQIAIRLNEMGVTAKRGGIWHRRSVRTIVLNTDIHEFEDLDITDTYVALP